MPSSPTPSKTSQYITEEELFSRLWSAAHDVKQALPEVEPASPFVENLRRQLEANVEHSRKVIRKRKETRKKATLLSVVIGSVVFSIGIGIIILRWLWNPFRKPMPQTTTPPVVEQELTQE
ncbi:MAG TPA: hypothetical protein PK299_12905 [Anaerolineales bacterium]|nr:hypothetical protein [Anaerolineales bacterium]